MHYAVSKTPGAVPKAFALALAADFSLGSPEIACKGWKRGMWDDPETGRCAVVVQGKRHYKVLAEGFLLQYTSVDRLLQGKSHGI